VATRLAQQKVGKIDGPLQSLVIKFNPLLAPGDVNGYFCIIIIIISHITAPLTHCSVLSVHTQYRVGAHKPFIAHLLYQVGQLGKVFGVLVILGHHCLNGLILQKRRGVQRRRSDLELTSSHTNTCNTNT